MCFRMRSPQQPAFQVCGYAISFYICSQLIRLFLVFINRADEILPKRTLITDVSTLVNLPNLITEAVLRPVVM